MNARASVVSTADNVEMEDEVYDRLYSAEDHHWWFRGRRAVISALIERARPAPEPRILDAGCGTGRNLADLAGLGPALGVDSSQRAVDYCNARGLAQVRVSPLERLPFEAGSFDLILLADVIEHVDDDEAVLAELGRVAAPGAVLIVTTPAYRWLWSRHDDRHHHRRRYTLRALRGLVAGSGWEPEALSYFNSLLLPPIAAVRLGQRLFPGEGADEELGTGRLNGLLALPMRAEAALIRRGVRLPAGVSIAALCRAPAES